MNSGAAPANYSHPYGQPASRSIQQPIPSSNSNYSHSSGAIHPSNYTQYPHPSHVPGILSVPYQSQQVVGSSSAQYPPPPPMSVPSKTHNMLPQPYGAVAVPYEQNPQAMKLQQLEEENTKLRNKVIEMNDENFGLQASVVAIEAEAQLSIKAEVDKIQSQLNFKNRELDEQSRENRKLLKELQELRQWQQQQQPQGHVGNGLSKQHSMSVPAKLSQVSTQVPSTSSKAAVSSSSSSSSNNSIQNHKMAMNGTDSLTRGALHHAVVTSNMNTIVEHFHLLLLALNPLTSTGIHASLMGHSYLQSPMAKMVTTPSRKPIVLNSTASRTSDSNSIAVVRSGNRSASKTPHSTPMRRFDHVATLTALSTELHHITTQCASGKEDQLSSAIIPFANKVLEVARHLWGLVKADGVLDDYHVGQQLTASTASPFTPALIESLLLLTTCLELTSSVSSRNGDAEKGSIAVGSSSSLAKNLASRFDVARSKNGHTPTLKAPETDRRGQLASKLHFPHLTSQQFNLVLEEKSANKDKAWFDLVEDSVEFVHHLLLLFHEYNQPFTVEVANSSSMSLLVKSIFPVLSTFIRSLATVQSQLAISTKQAAEVESMNLSLLQPRGQYRYSNLLGVILHPRMDYVQKSITIQNLALLLNRDRNFVEFSKYQHYRPAPGDHNATLSSQQKHTDKRKFPYKSFMHFLTEELLQPVSNVNGTGKNIEESWNYKLHVLQLLVAMLTQYGELTTALLFELGGKGILESEASAVAAATLTSSSSTATSQTNLAAMDGDEMDVDVEDNINDSALLQGATKLARNYSRTSTASSSSSRVADTAVTRTVSTSSNKATASSSLKRKHSLEEDVSTTDWNKFNLLAFAESIDGNKSGHSIGSWDRNNILRLCKFWCVAWRALDDIPVSSAMAEIDSCLLQCAILATMVVNAVVGKFSHAHKQLIVHVLRGEPWSLIRAFMYRYVSNGLHPGLKAAIGKDHIQHLDSLQD